MVYAKKILGTSSVLLLAGTSVLSTVSADSTDTSSSANPTATVSVGQNANLTLSARIEGNYKVIGNFTPLSDKKVQLYKITVSYADGGKSFIFTVPATVSSFTDWHARQNMVNTYQISALLEDGTMVTGNSVKVVMGANGEATTEDALGSVPPSPAGVRPETMPAKNPENKDGYMQMNQENRGNTQMSGNGMGRPPMMPMPTGELKDFIRNPLTPEEQEAFRTLLQKQQAERESLPKDMKPEERASKMKDLMIAHMNALLPYVSTDKQEAFKKMMEDRMAVMEKNSNIRKENQENRQEFQQKAQEQRQEFRQGMKEQRQEFKNQMQGKKPALSDKNRTLLDRLVSNLPLERLQAILAKVDKAASLTKKERLLAQLNEIRDIIQNKIDELTGVPSDDSVVQDILSTDTGSSAATTQQ